MLAAQRVLATGGARTSVRGMCAPAATPTIVTEIREHVADMKAKMAAGSGETYTPEAFESAFKAGTVDVSLLSTTLNDFDATAKKLAIKCVTDATSMLKEKASEEAIMADYNWDQWVAKGLDPALVAEVKAILAEGVEEEKALLPDLLKENGLDTLEKEIGEAFKGPDGYLELASKEELAAKAGMEKVIADLEKLEVDAVGLREVTIAEILEREPELRAEIEEDIANNKWGY